MKKLFAFVCTAISFLGLATTSCAAKKFISFSDVGSGEPIVLIHAFPTDQRLWAPQQQGLKDHFRVITFDLWGFGKSQAVDGNTVSMSDYADEVKQLLDQLHVKKAIVGGESMGGYIALAFLEKYPQRVNGLILSNTQSAPDSSDAKPKREQIAKQLLENGTASLIDGYIPKALTANASEASQKTLRMILNDQPATAMASALRGMAQRGDTSDVLAKTKVPVLIITSDSDNVISSEQSQKMHAAVKQSELVTIKNAAHLSSFEQPAAWNQAVIKVFGQQRRDEH